MKIQIHDVFWIIYRLNSTRYLYPTWYYNFCSLKKDSKQRNHNPQCRFSNPIYLYTYYYLHSWWNLPSFNLLIYYSWKEIVTNMICSKEFCFWSVNLNRQMIYLQIIYILTCMPNSRYMGVNTRQWYIYDQIKNT